MRYVQVDGDKVTGRLSTTGPPPPMPPGRRFVRLPDGVAAPKMGSTVVITGDKGDPIVTFDAGAVRFDPPSPQPPTSDPIATKLEEILTEVKKIGKP